jgi:2-polyprenyl-3-methyl-5-hydroxy-6-metoxy-1,4-benzoquinol methylase
VTENVEYTKRLERLESVWWKRLLDVQRPYRRNLQRLELGFTLDVGCGIGRNMGHLEGNAVGVDHNPESVAIARRRGYTAFLPKDFKASEYAASERFDALLCAHVVEHMRDEQARALLNEYLPYVRRQGRIVVITPQEAGYRSDPTHVQFADLDALRGLAEAIGLETLRAYSQPFPRPVGRIFKHNESVLVARRP